MNWTEFDGLLGVLISYISPHEDARGSLTELMRIDQLPDDWPRNELAAQAPVMAYMSWTHEGEVRGPHEHKKQFDYFVFAGPGAFELYLWDSIAWSQRHVLVLGANDDPACADAKAAAVIVPPGIVHGYKCIRGPGLVINMPSELYKGWDQKEEVDEIRHENDHSSSFQIPVR